MARIQIKASTQALWDPIAAEETTGVVGRKLKDPSDQKKVIAEAAEILAKCVYPKGEDERTTQLVIGYVQSGKTLSFTTLSGLAADNGYQIVIVIAGTTNDLANQSKDRLVRDLAIHESPWTNWVHFHNPGIQIQQPVLQTIQAWKSSNSLSIEKRVLLFTVLKQHVRLSKLVELIASLGDLSGTPVLIIDDEADQASLNTLVKKKELSTTYSILKQLRDLLPLHSFVQYTATPQANLLINLIDTLSADSATVIEPGDDYVGCDTFLETRDTYVKTIPSNEIATKNNLLDGPPPSLRRALMQFFVGVASGHIRRDRRMPNRSMMVHPAREIIEHNQYFVWISSLQRMWLQLLDGSIEDAERRGLLAEFSEAYEEIARTVADLEAWDEILNYLRSAIWKTEIREVNSASALRQVDWKTNYSWILVGGQVLDRGFTVEGLTVTYMPRGPGVGNADTIQQRARFLGYKRPYLGFCRIYLESDVIAAYRAYVEHESDVRRRIKAHAETGRSLKELRRIFICDRSLRPTRQSVLAIDYVRPRLVEGWYSPRYVPDSKSKVSENLEVVRSFLETHGTGFVETAGHSGRTEHMRHFIASGLPLATLYESLLADYQAGNMEDDQRWITLLIMLDGAISRSADLTASLIVMSKGEIRKRIARDNKVVNLFQGPHPDAAGAIYPGDRKIVGPDPISIQLHMVRLMDATDPDHEIEIFGKAPLLTAWIAPAIRRDILFQNQ